MAQSMALNIVPQPKGDTGPAKGKTGTLSGKTTGKTGQVRSDDSRPDRADKPERPVFRDVLARRQAIGQRRAESPDDGPWKKNAEVHRMRLNRKGPPGPDSGQTGGSGIGPDLIRTGGEGMGETDTRPVPADVDRTAVRKPVVMKEQGNGDEENGVTAAIVISAESPLKSVGNEDRSRRREPQSGEKADESARIVRMSTRSEETRKADIPLLLVRDRRTGTGAAGRASRKGKPVLVPVAARRNAAADEAGPSTSRDFALYLREDGDRSATEVKDAPETLRKADFRDLLSRELREGGNDQIVRQIRMSLSDGGKGEIRLFLKPEHLGRVRIALDLNENHIAGRILVENNTVRQAFLDNMNDLVRSFRESGFDAASLDVGLENEGGQSREGAEKKDPYFSDRLKDFQDSVPRTDRPVGRHGLVDLIA